MIASSSLQRYSSDNTVQVPSTHIDNCTIVQLELTRRERIENITYKIRHRRMMSLYIWDSSGIALHMATIMDVFSHTEYICTYICREISQPQNSREDYLTPIPLVMFHLLIFLHPLLSNITQITSARMIGSLQRPTTVGFIHPKAVN